MDATNALFNDGVSEKGDGAVNEEASNDMNSGSAAPNQAFEMRTINSLLKKQNNDVNTLYQAVKLVSKY